MEKNDRITAKRARRRSVPHLAAFLFAAFLIVGISSATASAYWDYQGNLNPGGA